MLPSKQEPPEQDEGFGELSMSSHRSATIIVFAVVLIIGLGVSPRMPQSQAADSLGALSEA
ncbi:uncharacterized protein METZ01_LOCUS390664, partial [marine metagenome]